MAPKMLMTKALTGGPPLQLFILKLELISINLFVLLHQQSEEDYIAFGFVGLSSWVWVHSWIIDMTRVEIEVVGFGWG